MESARRAIILGLASTMLLPPTRTMALASGKSSGPFGQWLVEDIGGGGVVDILQTTLDIQFDGNFSGNGGCNRYAGTATIAGDQIVFGSARSTFMACHGAIMDQEGKFHAALAEVRVWRIDTERSKLLLSASDGKRLITLARQ